MFWCRHKRALESPVVRLLGSPGEMPLYPALSPSAVTWPLHSMLSGKVGPRLQTEDLVGVLSGQQKASLPHTCYHGAVSTTT